MVAERQEVGALMMNLSRLRRPGCEQPRPPASPGEDRAEIIATMMVNPPARRRIAAKDSILGAKGRMLRSALIAWNRGFAAVLEAK